MSVGGDSDNQTAAPVRVLALCKTPGGIAPTISFLSRRGVQITPVTTVQQMLDNLGERLFDYVFISINYPHQKLDSIPGLLSRSYNIECVMFAEKWDRRAEAMMANLRVKHVIYGPLTGPSSLLKIRQLVKLASEEKEESLVVSGKTTAKGPAAIVIKNTKQSSESMVFKNEHAQPEEIANLMKILSEADTESALLADLQATPPPDHKVLMAKGPAPKILAHLPHETGSERGLAVFKQDPRISASEKKSFANAQSSGESEAQTPDVPSAKVLPFPNARTPLKRIPDQIAQNPKLRVIWESARRAVLDVTHATEVFETAISRIHSLALLSINSDSVRGCFLLTAGKGKSFPYGALGDLQQRFLFHLFEAGQHIKDSECEVIEIDASSLPDGAFIDSDFALTASSDVAELSISFLDIAPANPSIERSALDDFSRIQLKDVATGIPLTFDAYIYMPLNQKTLKYLKQGGVLGLKQKTKLMDDGTEHLYIKEESVDNFKEFHARASLHEVFESRKEGSEKKKAG